MPFIYINFNDLTIWDYVFGLKKKALTSLISDTDTNMNINLI